MPNVLDANGMQVATEEELVEQITANLKAVYGDDIDLSSASPDGQMMMIFVRIILDLQDKVLQSHASFDPDEAIGNQLDARVALNGIQRQGGTYTVTPISITVDRALTLYGLDQEDEPVYTVADNAGNQWQLLETQTPGGAGTNSYQFQAAEPGRVFSTVNTITVPVSIVLGVTAINNPSTYSSLGEDEESDAALKIRRQQSVRMSSQGFYDALYAALGNVSGVTSVQILNNRTSTEDADGVPAHSIWVILAGSGADADIAAVIYAHIGFAGMKGNQSYEMTQEDGTAFMVYWDEVETENVYIEMVVDSIDGINPPKINEILLGLPSLYVPGVGETMNINQLASYIQQIDPNCLVTEAGLSLSGAGPFISVQEPSAKNKQLVLLQQNIYVTPTLVLPITAVVEASATRQFNAYGGTQSFTWALTQNESGGSVDPATGEYEAGATPGTDILRATDGDGNEAFATVTVI